VLFAFDLIEHDGDDLRDLPLIERKRLLARLIGRTKRRSIQFVEHLTGDGPTVFEHVCRLGLEGVVSKRTDAPYRAGRQRMAQVENPASEAVRREARGGVALTAFMLSPVICSSCLLRFTKRNNRTTRPETMLK